MNWIEVYHLRASEEAVCELMHTLPSLGEDISHVDGFVRSQILRPENYQHELVVSIEWKGGFVAEGSIMGLSLKNYLSQFGSVKERIWVVDSMKQNAERVRHLV